jgi:hypothetical protein
MPKCFAGDEYGKSATDFAADVPQWIDAARAGVVAGSELTDIGHTDESAGANLAQVVDSGRFGRWDDTEQHRQAAHRACPAHPRPMWRRASA